MTDDEALTLRSTVIGGQRCANDWTSIGRIIRTINGPTGQPEWYGTAISMAGRPTATRAAPAAASTMLRPGSERHGKAFVPDLSKTTSPGRTIRQASAEALARYDRKGG